jgi:hypothetical protein
LRLASEKFEKQKKNLKIKNSGFCYKNKTSNVFQFTGDFLILINSLTTRNNFERKKIVDE